MPAYRSARPGSNARPADAVTQRAGGFDVRWSLDMPQEPALATRTGRRETASIAALHPVLLVMELEHPVDWLPRVHGDPATRRIPIIAITASEP